MSRTASEIGQSRAPRPHHPLTGAELLTKALHLRFLRLWLICRSFRLGHPFSPPELANRDGKAKLISCIPWHFWSTPSPPSLADVTDAIEPWWLFMVDFSAKMLCATKTSHIAAVTGADCQDIEAIR